MMVLPLTDLRSVRKFKPLNERVAAAFEDMTTSPEEGMMVLPPTDQQCVQKIETLEEEVAAAEVGMVLSLDKGDEGCSP
jgi:hypothetical protein